MAADRKHSERIESLHDYGIDEETRSIYFYDDVHDDSAAALIKNLNVLCTDNDKPVNIYMQTLGGCGFSGITLHDYIRSLRNNHVTIIVMGYCMSAGPIILQAADTRVCMPNSSIMIHEGSLFVNDTLSNSTEWARVAQKQNDDMVNIFAEKMGEKPSILKKKIKVDMFFTAEEALEKNLVDEIWGT